MLTAEMKQQLIERIISSKDENLLEEFYRIMEISSAETEVVELSEEQTAAVEQGLKDIGEGKFLSNEDANREIEKWLKK